MGGGKIYNSQYNSQDHGRGVNIYETLRTFRNKFAFNLDWILDCLLSG